MRCATGWLCLLYLANGCQQLRKSLCISLINICLDPSIFTTILQKHFLIYLLKTYNNNNRHLGEYLILILKINVNKQK